MRKWFFIVLPVLIVSLFLIDYLIFSAEHSYQSVEYNRAYKPGKKSDEMSEGSLSVDKTDDKSGKKIRREKKTLVGYVVRKPRPANLLWGSKLGDSSAQSIWLPKAKQSGSNARSSSVSLNVPAQESSDSKASFIAGTPPPVFFSLDFINEQVIKHNFQIEGVPVGGLSALSYNPETNVFIALSDVKTALSEGKNEKGSPRFYELKLVDKSEGRKRKYELEITKQVFLSNKKTGKLMPIDPEGVALSKSNQMFISSEGAQLPELNIYAPPAVFMFNSKGEWLSSLPLPDMYWPDDPDRLEEWGVKENKAFEALSVDSAENQLWLSTESALNQDEQGGDDENKQYVRISQFDIKTTRMNNQFLYQMDSDVEVNNLTGRNGLTDFFSLGGRQLLTVERTYLKDESVAGNRKTDANLVRLFLTDCSGADNVSEHQNLKKGQFVTCGKRLLADLSSIIGDRVDNIEGITIGPSVKEGGYLLVLVSDNNFNQAQKTQFLFFHYLPDGENRN